MTEYVTKGKLTGVITYENYDEALQFLTEDDMTQFMDESIAGVVTQVKWFLEEDGQRYTVTALTTRDLTDDELRVLSEWVSGQNSDGLGESFEQQDFAQEPNEGDCGDCEGCENGYTCDEELETSMISFDWKTNKSEFVKI